LLAATSGSLLGPSCLLLPTPPARGIKGTPDPASEPAPNPPARAAVPPPRPIGADGFLA